MLNLSYTPIPILNTYLRRVEGIRRSILAVPLSVSSELRLRWEARISITRAVMSFSGHYMKYSDIVKVCSDIVEDKDTKEQSDSFSINLQQFFDTLGFINYHWLVRKDKITEKTVIDIFKKGCEGSLVKNEKELKHLCEYLEVSTEHPLIQAAIVYIQILKIVPFSKDNEKLASLLSHTVLCKYGHDVRGSISPEEYWYQNINEYKKNLQNSLEVVGMTDWIVFYVKSVSSQLEKVLSEIESSSVSWKTEVRSELFNLTDRQKGILASLEDPTSSITNKKVQKMFKVSQITASRDLAGLEKLGLLFSHGKGRSVFYTRV